MVNYKDEEESNLENSSSGNFSLLKFDNDLFRDESYVPQKMISVRRSKDKGWDVSENNKIVLKLKSNSFTPNEFLFLETVQGMQFLLKIFKEKILTLEEVKNKLQEHFSK